MPAAEYDVAVIGAGIVGAATAWQLQTRYPHRRVLLLDKEPSVARHQSGRNSGVVHAGVYYPPGSLKARFCRQGLEQTLAFCEQHRLPVARPGKLLVATDARELRRMLSLQQRCLDNGVECELLDAGQLREREPHVRGQGAIHVPATAITDFAAICRRMTDLLTAAGGSVRLQARVTVIRENDGGIELQTPDASLRVASLVCCAGLHADRVARAHGLDVDFRIVPFRGEYYRLPRARDGLLRHLIYPIPDPALPFLGVHFTPMLDGGIIVGPNAVPGWKREGYGRVNLHPADVLEMLAFRGFWRLAGRYLGHAARETFHSLCKPAYLRQVHRYCPGIRLSELQPHPVGVRAQAVLADGTLVGDFLFRETPRSLHVCNAPSPAATSALPIADHICSKLAAKLGW